MVGVANHELDLRDVSLAHPCLTGTHQASSKPCALRIGADSEVVDPSTVTVMAHHRRPEQRALVAENGEDGRRTSIQGTPKIGFRIVPGPREPSYVPERNGVREERLRQIDDVHRLHSRTWRYGEIYCSPALQGLLRLFRWLVLPLVYEILAVSCRPPQGAEVRKLQSTRFLARVRYRYLVGGDASQPSGRGRWSASPPPYGERPRRSTT